MSDRTTVRAPILEQGSPAERRSSSDGLRHRCMACREHPPLEPRYLCHHCGRVYCERCAPRPDSLTSLLTATHPGSAREREHHCRRDVHPSPRLGAWTIAGVLGVLTLAALMLLFQFSQTQAMLVPIALFVAWIALGIGWRYQDARRHLPPRFVLDGPVPVIHQRELLAAEVTLGADYRERWVGEGAVGEIEAMIPLSPALHEALDTLVSRRALDEHEVEDIVVVAGIVVLESAEHVRRFDPPLPYGGARRWRIEAPLSGWRYLYERKGAAEQRLVARYELEGWGGGGAHAAPFPLQLLARYVGMEGRRTLEITLEARDLQDEGRLERLVLRRGSGMPAFDLISAGGRLRSQHAPDEIELGASALESGGRLRLRLALAQPLADRGPVWLEGKVSFSSPRPISGLEVVALYDARGGRVTDEWHYRRETRVDLDFRIDLAALPHQGLSSHEGSFELPGVSLEGQRRIAAALENESRLLQSHERLSRAGGERPATATWSLMGSWSPARGDAVSPATYVLTLTPLPDGTRVHLRVEAVVADATGARDRAPAIWRRIRALIERAVAGQPPGHSLLSRLREESGE